MTSTDICNMALSRIGEPPVTDITDSGDSTRARVVAALHYDHTVQELLRTHRWNFAIKRTILEPTWVSPTAYADNGSGLFRVTKSSHGLSTNDRVTFHESTNYAAINGTWRITVINSNTFDLVGSTFSGSSTVDGEYTPAGMWDYDYSIAAPADMLRALEDERYESQIETAWVLESGRVLCNTDELEFSYIEDVTDVSRFDPLFVAHLILRLAIKFETDLRGASAKTQEIAAELVQLTGPVARRIDANEGQPRERIMPWQSRFVAARANGV